MVRDMLFLFVWGFFFRRLIPKETLVILGHKRGGRVWGRVLRALGFEIVHLSLDQPTTLRTCVKHGLNARWIVVSADGPFGPYGVRKPGAAWLARKCDKPLHQIRFEPKGCIVVKKYRGGLRVPLPLLTAREVLTRIQVTTRAKEHESGTLCSVSAA